MRERGVHARHRRHFRLAVALLVCGLVITLGPDTFPLITVRAFLFPGAVLLLMAGILLAVRRAPWMVDGTVLTALICIAPIILASPRRICMASGTADLKIAQMNVHQANSSFADVVAVARTKGADLITFQEVDAQWEAALVDGLADLYPYHLIQTANDNYGIAVFSRSPLEDAVVFDLSGLPAISAMLRVGPLHVQVISVHLRSPEGFADLEQRNTQWTMVSGIVKKCSGAVIVVGDLNTVPWDDAAKRFTGNTSMAWGTRPLASTWPSVAGFSMIPLDHVLTSPGLCATETHTFLIPGSDHRGLSAAIEVGL